MQFLRLTSHDVYQNLATEEYFLVHKPTALFMLWINENCIVLGKNQNSYKEVNQEYVEKHKIKVVRRMTGGGAVFHDLGNLNFTFIEPEKDGHFLNFKKFLKPVVRTLERLGIKAQISGRNDILIDGKKFSGSAQSLVNGWILHHGTIMFSVSTSHVSKALNVNPLKIKAKGLDSVKSRITNIRDHLNKPLSINQFCEMLLAEVLRDFPSITPYELDPEDKQQIEALRVNKYATWAHNYGQNPHYELNNTLYVSGVGLVEVYLNVENGLISDLKFYGDFFGKKDVAHVENHLRKVRYSRPDILRRLSEIQGFNDYFNNLDPAVLADLVVGLVPQEGVKKIWK